MIIMGAMVAIGAIIMPHAARLRPKPMMQQA
jgi:hypothetical protein